MKITKYKLKQIIKEEISNALSEAATLQHQTKAAHREYLDSLPKDKRQAYEEYKRLSAIEIEDPFSPEAEDIAQQMEDLKPIVEPIYREIAALGKDFASKRGPIKHQPSQGGGTAAGYDQMYETLSPEEMRAHIEKETGLKVMSPEDIERSRKDLERRRAAAKKRREEQAAELEKRRLAGEFDDPEPFDWSKIRLRPQDLGT